MITKTKILSRILQLIVIGIVAVFCFLIYSNNHFSTISMDFILQCIFYLIPLTGLAGVCLIQIVVSNHEDKNNIKLNLSAGLIVRYIIFWIFTIIIGIVVFCLEWTAVEISFMMGSGSTIVKPAQYWISPYLGFAAFLALRRILIGKQRICAILIQVAIYLAAPISGIIFFSSYIYFLK